MNEKLDFQGKSYSVDSLTKMSDEKLLSLRNLVAENLGVARVKGFKDHDQAVTATWKALEKFAATADDEVASKETKTAKVKEPKAPKAHAGYLKVVMPKRVTKKMFAKIQRLRNPETGKDRSFAWPDYPDGLRVIDAMMSENLHHEKIHWWANQEPPYLRLIEPTDEEFFMARDKWYADHGLPNPDKIANETRIKLKMEREAQKAEKEAAREAKKAELAELKKQRAEKSAIEKALRDEEKAKRAAAKASK